MDQEQLAASLEQLTNRLNVVTYMTRTDMARAIERHDLTRTHLAGIEATARRQDKAGLTVTAGDFWLRTAEPQAGVMLAACSSVQDESRTSIGDLIRRHVRQVDPDAMGVDHPLVAAWTEQVLTEIRRMAPAMVPRTTVNELGDWWQQRLRRRAALRAVPRSLLAPATHLPLLVDAQEIYLSQLSPWSHGDRMLAAFELAHNQLRGRAVEIEQDLIRLARAAINTASTPAEVEPAPPKRPMVGPGQGSHRNPRPAGRRQSAKPEPSLTIELG